MPPAAVTRLPERPFEGAAPERVAHDSLPAALAAFQAEVPRVGKHNDATVTSDKGSYRYSYADLSDITAVALPLLARHGLSWVTKPTMLDGAFVLHYQLIHESGGVEDGHYPLGRPDVKAQVAGSAITYARRYCLCAVTGIAPEDEDEDGAAATRAHSQHGGGQARPAQRREQPTHENRAMDAVRRILGSTTSSDARKAAAWVDENGMSQTVIDAPPQVREEYAIPDGADVTLGALGQLRIERLQDAEHTRALDQARADDERSDHQT